MCSPIDWCAWAFGYPPPGSPNPKSLRHWRSARGTYTVMTAAPTPCETPIYSGSSDSVCLLQSWRPWWFLIRIRHFSPSMGSPPELTKIESSLKVKVLIFDSLELQRESLWKTILLCLGKGLTSNPLWFGILHYIGFFQPWCCNIHGWGIWGPRRWGSLLLVAQGTCYY